MASDLADQSAVLTAIGDHYDSGPRGGEAQPYPDLLPQVRVALDWLAWEQPAGAAWPKDGVVYPIPAGPDVTLRVFIGPGEDDDYRATVMFERYGAGPVPRITRDVADRLHATLAAHTTITYDLGKFFLPGTTYTWWAFATTTLPSRGLADAHRLNQTGIYTSIHDPAWRERVARLHLPAGWMPDRGREYR